MVETRRWKKKYRGLSIDTSYVIEKNYESKHGPTIRFHIDVCTFLFVLYKNLNIQILLWIFFFFTHFSFILHSLCFCVSLQKAHGHGLIWVGKNSNEFDFPTQRKFHRSKSLERQIVTATYTCDFEAAICRNIRPISEKYKSLKKKKLWGFKGRKAGQLWSKMKKLSSLNVETTPKII